MVALPEAVSKAWNGKEGPVIFSTVDEDGMPNAIYVTCVAKYGEEMLLVADNFFDKTRKNIFSGSKGSMLFITSEGKSYQVKGSIEYHQEGSSFEDMKKWNPTKHPGHAAVALKIEEVYSGAEKLL